MAMLTSHLLLSVYIITFVIGVPTNILAFCTFCRKVRRKPTPIDILLLNLTISDLLFLAFLPFKMKEAADDMTWLLPDSLCFFTGFLFYVCVYNSTLLLMAVSVERYLGVAFPLRYSLCRRPRYAVAVSVVFWLASSLNLSVVYIVPCSPWINGDTNADTDTNATAIPNTCYLEFTEAQLQVLLPVRLELFVVFFCVPFLVSCYCYFHFIRILSRLPHIGRRRRLRAIGLVLASLLVFAVCFGPYNTSHVVGYVRMDSEWWRDLALLSSTFNACLDPIVFYFSSAAVRSMLRRGVRGLEAKLHVLRCGGAPCCGGAPPRPGRAKADKYKVAATP